MATEEIDPSIIKTATKTELVFIAVHAYFFSYRLLMTNGRKGDILHYHFSADEFYILPILVVAFFEHLVVFFLSSWSAVVLKGRQLLHATYKIYLLSVILHVSALITSCFGLASKSIVEAEGIAYHISNQYCRLQSV